MSESNHPLGYHFCNADDGREYILVRLTGHHLDGWLLRHNPQNYTWEIMRPASTEEIEGIEGIIGKGTKDLDITVKHSSDPSLN